AREIAATASEGRTPARKRRPLAFPKPLAKLVEEAALSHSRLADDRHHASGPAGRFVEVTQQQRELALASGEWGQAADPLRGFDASLQPRVAGDAVRDERLVAIAE